MFSLLGWAAQSVKEEPARSPQGKNDTGKAADSQYQSAPIITITNNLSPASEAKPDKKEHGENSTSAEERVALWTERLTYTTGALALFTLLLWVATYRLFLDSKKTAEKHLRAYVMIPDVSVAKMAARTNNLEPLVEPPLLIPMHNFGQTPASKCTFWIDIVSMPYPLKGDLIRTGAAVVGSVSGIAPNSTFTANIPIPLLENDYRIYAGKYAAYIFGEIEYFDVFGKKRTTHLRFYKFGNGWQSEGEWYVHADGNDAT